MNTVQRIVRYLAEHPETRITGTSWTAPGTLKEMAMDPTETLQLLRARLTAAALTSDPHSETNEAADLFEALDEWLTKGGFLPTQWARSKPEQVFEVRVHCDGASLVVGRYYDYARALAHVALLKGREKEMALLGASGADVVPVEVMP